VAFGIAAVVLVVLLVFAVNQISSVAKTDGSHNSVVGSVYVGEWQDVRNPASVIQILPDGSASCQIVHGMSHYSINGGRATFNKETRHLAIKFFFLGPDWFVEEPPHQTADGLIMKLGGDTFRKVQSYPSPSDTKGPKESI
jgi:hypothetical protein